MLHDAQVVVEEVEMQRELFYTEGEEALLQARKAIAEWSLPRAAQRVAAQKRQQADLQSLQVGARFGKRI
jgi:U4/U6 small nuclear ribonucleoprotein PRP4